LSDRSLILDVGPARAWTNGRISAFVKRHALAWELSTAALTVAYVVLAFFQDKGSSGPVTTGVVVLAGAFFLEFTLRLYDAPSRKSYLRQHWLDIVTCIPVVGPFRALRLVRLVAFVRIGATARTYGVGASASDRLPGGAGVWVLAPILIIVWLAASYGYYELEGGVNPHVKTFGDAMYFAFVTASTVGYGDVTPVTPEGKVLTGILIFLGIGLLGFASAQLTAKLLPRGNEVGELRTSLDRQTLLLQELSTRLETVTGLLEHRPEPVLTADESLDTVSQRL
jgi:voltage-gated potassium channel